MTWRSAFTKGSARRGALAVVLGGVAFVVFLYVQPLLTIRVLAKSLDKSDAEAMRERMDFESVRGKLREDFLARLDGEADEGDEYAARVTALALCSRGIEMIIATRGSEATDSEAAKSEQDVPTEIVDWGYDTTSRFHATVQEQTGAAMTLVLQRRGMSWQVIEMEPPESAWQELERFQQLETGE